MSRLLLPISLFLVMLLWGCCPPTSLHPLSSAEQADYDQRLEGTWQHLSEDKGLELLHIGRTEGKLTRVVMIEHQENGKLEFSTFTIFPTVSRGEYYLNVRAEELFEELPPDQAGYVFARYELAGDLLTVYSMTGAPFAKAIQAGRLQGKITYREDSRPGAAKKIDCIRITDQPENILDFIQKMDPKIIFPDEMKLKRVHFPENSDKAR